MGTVDDIELVVIWRVHLIVRIGHVSAGPARSGLADVLVRNVAQMVIVIPVSIHCLFVTHYYIFNADHAAIGISTMLL